MSELLSSQKVNLPKKSKGNSTTVHLTFHIPEGMKDKLIANDSIMEELEELKKLEALKIVESLRKIEAIKAVENLEIAEVKYVEESREDSAEQVQSVVQEKLHINEGNEDVYPFLSLNLNNQQNVFKIGSSFVSDIQKGQKHFGFANLAKSSDERHLLAYAALINYSLKKSVLVVVKDIEDKSFDKFRAQFTVGTLWKWKTYDWGNLCFVDYKEISKHAEEFSNVDLTFITHEFSAVLWSVPSENVQDELQRAALPILGKLDSVTFVISKGETKNKNVKKASAYFNCFSIPVKGILVGDGAAEGVKEL